MSGEMFGDRQDARTFQSSCVSDTLLRHSLRILAKRTQADHGLIHIAIHVHIRSEIYMNSHFPALPSHLFSIFLDQGIVLDSA